ncbi:hypothetical protein Hbl1158_04620 [Halobaculum sp. CBA1158]|uniref:hypothetical protein n=1 Tax=Halobaculum sp. CBA1158 TaxID=2904243 RepID=UPI001F33253B|nr:hypothetical protein [Halobaculum sp. CBA1158]UIP00649.1 hypothetical protein Hbl1158_04620 [Halobaculum sp. CBA1158]
MTRSDSATRWAATALATIAGLGLASAHWLGLVAGAALVSLPQRTLPRGVAAGVAFGGLALLVAGASLALAGPAAVETARAMRQPLAVAAGASLVAGAVGGLVRGVVG